MFSYEENEKIVNKAITKCIRESWEYVEDEEGIELVLRLLKKMNFIETDLDSIAVKLFLQDVFMFEEIKIGNDVEKAKQFIKTYSEDIKSEIDSKRMLNKMAEEYPNIFD